MSAYSLCIHIYRSFYYCPLSPCPGTTTSMLEHQPNILLGSLAKAFEFRSIMLFCLLTDLGFYLMYRCAFNLWQWQRGFKLLMDGVGDYFALRSRIVILFWMSCIWRWNTGDSSLISSDHPDRQSEKRMKWWVVACVHVLPLMIHGYR